jgi:tetratricopeptide (TPR) repeat protein
MNGQMVRLGVVAAVVVTLAGAAFADWQQGVEAYKARSWAEAAEHFKGVVETNPDYAGAYYMLGICQSRLDKTSQALANLRKAVELDGDNLQYQQALGQALVAADKFDEAYRILEEIPLSAVAEGNRSSHALLLARAATKTNRSEEAAQVVRAQLRADGNNARLHQALGVAEDAMGNYGRSYEAFKRAFELDSSLVSTGRSAVSSAILAARQTRSPSEKKGYYRKAGEVAERVAEKAPKFDHFLVAGEAWLGAKEYSRALRWFDKAHERQPNNALVLLYRGQAQSSLGEFSAALAELQDALKQNPEAKLRRSIYNQLGYVYAKRKAYDDAIAAYRNAGNDAKVAEVQDAKDKHEQNIKAEREQEEYERKMRELEEKKKELEELMQGGGGR